MTKKQEFNISESRIIEATITKGEEVNFSLNPNQKDINLDINIPFFKGDKGERGETPIKGTDYFTKEDIEGLNEYYSLKDHIHKDKIDTVVLDDQGNIVFSAEGVVVAIIPLPKIEEGKKAICGEFLCDEVLVGQKITTSENTKGRTVWVDGVTPVNAKNMNKLEDAILNHEHDFINTSYKNEGDPTITTVKSALDKLLYFNLSISLSSNVAATLEKGVEVPNVVFTWNYNKAIVSQSFEGVNLSNDIRSYTHSTPFNSNKTFRLVANDGQQSSNRSISFSFLNGRYWGVSSATEHDSAFIRTLNKELSSSRGKTFTVNCGSTQFIYYVIPSSFGTPTFTVGGFSGGFSKIKTLQYTNSSGYIESYDIWKSTNSNLGTTTVVVS